MKSAERILGDLEMHLKEKIVPARKLIEMGWRDFRDIDHPQTADAVTLAREAFLYLSISENGNWNETMNVLVAIKSYLDGETGYEAQYTDLQRLAALLREKPVRAKEVRDWFESVYR